MGKKKRKINDQVNIRAIVSKELMEKLNGLDTNDPKYEKTLYKICENIIAMKRSESTKQLHERGMSENDPVSENEIFKINTYYEKRRNSASVAYMKHAAEKFRNEYPECSVEQIVAAVLLGKSAYMPDASPGHDERLDIALASAIYILDDLNINDNLIEAMLYIPVDEKVDSIEISESFEDAVYDKRLIKGLIYLIMNRNNTKTVFLNHESVKRTKKNVPARTYIKSELGKWLEENNADEDKLSEKAEEMRGLDETIQRMSCRECLDKILSFMSESTINRAETNFRNDIDAFLKVMLDISGDLWLQMTAAMAETDKSEAKLKQTESILNKQVLSAVNPQKRKPSILDASSLSRLTQQAPLSDAISPFAGQNHFEIHITSDVDIEEYLENISRHKELVRNANDLADRYSKLICFSANNRSFYDKYRTADDNNKPVSKDTEEWLEAMFDQLKKFSVRNPYETCFAYFELLDSGDDIIWAVEMAIAVLRYAVDMLPWRNIPYDRDDIESENDDTENDDRQLYSEQTDNILYQPKYSSYWLCDDMDLRVDKDGMWDMSLSQILYHSSGIIPPRMLNDKGVKTQKALVKSGFSRSSTDIARVLIQYSRCGRKMRAAYDVASDSSDISSQQNELIDVVKKAFCSETSEPQNQAAVKKLKKELYDTKRLLKESQKEYNQLLKDAERDKQELAELREIIYNLQNSEAAEETDDVSDDEIELPYKPKANVVVFGGHESWLRAFKLLVKDVRVVDPYTKPDINLIRNADVVWIQNNAIPHSFYNRIMNIVRSRKIPVKYFAYASASKCAVQLAKYDMSSDA